MQQAVDSSAKRHGIAASTGAGGSRSAVYPITGGVSPTGSPRRRDFMVSLSTVVAVFDVLCHATHASLSRKWQRFSSAQFDCMVHVWDHVG
jgi:hypothetical protein